MSIFLIKLIAAASMLLDHTGMILFPDVLWLRIAGQTAATWSDAGTAGSG